MKLNLKKFLPVCVLCLLLPIACVSAFTKEEDNTIIEFVAKNGGSDSCNWHDLSEILGEKYPVEELKQRHAVLLNPHSTRSRGRTASTNFTAEDDATIKQFVEEHGGNPDSCNWTQLAEEFGGKFKSNQLYDRYTKCLNPKIIKGSWTETEDQMIIDWVKKHGAKSWSKLAKVGLADARTGKQCRERWVNRLDPNVNTGPWTTEEDEIIRAYVAERGNEWTKIAQLLTGRTDNAIKNRWNSTLKLGRNIVQQKRGRKPKINNPAQKTALPIQTFTSPADSDFTQNSDSIPSSGTNNFSNDDFFFPINNNIQSPVGSLLNENFSTGFNGTSNLENDDLPSSIGTPFGYGGPLFATRFPSNVNFAHLDLSLTGTPQDDFLGPPINFNSSPCNDTLKLFSDSE